MTDALIEGRLRTGHRGNEIPDNLEHMYSIARTACRIDLAGGGGATPLRADTKRGLAVTFEFRQRRYPLGAKNEERAGADSQEAAPDLAVEGEMHGDAALAKQALDRVFPGSGLTADANLLIMPNLDAANIAYDLLRVAASGGVTVGPILLGADKPVHILTQTATVRGILNMTALAAVDATQTNTRAMTKLAAE